MRVIQEMFLLFDRLFSVTRKVAAYFSEVLEHEKDKLAENLLANNGIKSYVFSSLFLINYFLSSSRMLDIC